MKTQMKFQKILTLSSLLLAAVCAVLAIFMCSGIVYQSSFYTTAKMPTDPKTSAPVTDMIGADALHAFIQGANNIMVVMAIIAILVVVTLYITASNSRRKYYITNYVAIGLVVVYFVVFAIVGFIIYGQALGLAAQIDMEKWKALYDQQTVFMGLVTKYYPQNYSGNTAFLILGLISNIFVLAAAAGWVLNTIWKIKLMQGEKALLASGAMKEVM